MQVQLPCIILATMHCVRCTASKAGRPEPELPRGLHTRTAARRLVLMTCSQPPARPAVRAGEPSFEELAEMPYLDAALKEASRLFPAGAYASREAKSDLVLDGARLPAGAFAEARTSVFGP